MKTTIVISLLLFFNTAFAADSASRKAELASQFYDATTKKQIDAIASEAASRILREDPTKVRQSEIYREWALESFSSPEYKAIYVEYMIEMFTEEDLGQMNAWAKSAAFQKYFAIWPKFQAWSGARFQSFLRQKNPDLMRRLSAEGLR